MINNSTKIFQFKIQLDDIEPEIWRIVKIKSSDSFSDLHDLIQKSMGWFDYHLHEFTIKNNSTIARIGPIIDDEFEKPIDETLVNLNHVFYEENQEIFYEYDFGDSWQHKIILEKILEPDAGIYPSCIAGARACPLENSGGVYGYQSVLDVLKNPEHDDYAMIMEWCGKFDSEYFNLEKTNEIIKKIKIKDSQTYQKDKEDSLSENKIIEDLQSIATHALTQMYELYNLKKLDQDEIINIITGFVSTISSTAADMAEIISPGSGVYVYADLEALAKKGGIKSIMKNMMESGSPQYSLSDMEDDDLESAMNYIGQSLLVSMTKSTHELPKTLRTSEVQLRGIESLLSNFLSQRFYNSHDILDSFSEHVHVYLNDLEKKNVH